MIYYRLVREKRGETDPFSSLERTTKETVEEREGVSTLENGRRTKKERAEWGIFSSSLGIERVICAV